jgi:hypothetical protein
MKLTKSYLKQLILEELRVTEGATTGEYRTGMKDQATDTQTGITGEERTFLLSFTAALKKAAEIKNLKAAGQITTLLKRLEDELVKLLRDQAKDNTQN